MTADDTGYRCPIHWFAYYGQVGTSAPTCRRCGAANPNYDRDRDPYATEDAR